MDRLGGKYPVPIDVRVVATTNIRIEDQVREGKFRKDLYYRLNVIPLRIPPLRGAAGRHRAAWPSISSRNTARKTAPESALLRPKPLRKLTGYPWPGNVRELQNVVQRAVLISDSPVLGPECIIFDPGLEPEAGAACDFSLMPLCEVEKIMIEKALCTVEGNRTRGRRNPGHQRQDPAQQARRIPSKHWDQVGASHVNPLTESNP